MTCCHHCPTPQPVSQAHLVPGPCCASVLKPCTPAHAGACILKKRASGWSPNLSYGGSVAFLPGSLTRSTQGQSGRRAHRLLSQGHTPGASVRRRAGAQPAGDTHQQQNPQGTETWCRDSPRLLPPGLAPPTQAQPLRRPISCSPGCASRPHHLPGLHLMLVPIH